MSKLAILVVVLLGLAYFIDAREERLFFGRRQNVRRWKNKRQDVGVQVVGSQVSTGSSGPRQPGTVTEEERHQRRKLRRREKKRKRGHTRQLF